MPNATPVWKLPYPCPGDIVGADDFLAFDAALDEALSAMDAKKAELRTRNTIRWYRDTPTNVAANAGLNIVPGTIDFELNWPTPLTIPRSGLYFISAQVGPGDNTAAQLTAEAVSILFSTSPVVIQVTRYNDPLVDLGMWKAVAGIALLTAGETITWQYSPQGTAGTVTINYAGFQGHLIYPT